MMTNADVAEQQAPRLAVNLAARAVAESMDGSKFADGSKVDVHTGHQLDGKPMAWPGTVIRTEKTYLWGEVVIVKMADGTTRRTLPGRLRKPKEKR